MRTPSTGGPPVPEVETPPTQSELEKRIDEMEKLGRGWEVTRVIINLTVTQDDCAGWAIYVGWGGASQEEALIYCGRQGPLEGIP